MYDEFRRLCAVGSVDDIEAFIKSHNIDLNYDDYEFINIASRRRIIRLIEVFVEHGANVHFNNDILLGLALERGDVNLVKYFIENQNFDPEKLKGTNAYLKYQLLRDQNKNI